METIKIQINHTEPLTLKKIATILHDEIGEINDLSLEDIEEYFTFLSTNLLPNETFISVITFEIPELVLREKNLEEIIISYLNSLNALDSIISITKVNDTYFQKKSTEYYQEIIDLEMDMRNVLTYIITYDKRRINKELFKDFGIKIAEDLESDKIKQNHENGFFYILFKDYKSFLDIEPLNQKDINNLLLNPTITSFEDFKTKLPTKILETRHLDFLASIKDSFKQLDNIRNSIMHIHSLSNSEMRNYEKHMNDTDMDKSLKTKINDFWNNENELLKEETFIKLAQVEIENIFKEIDDNKDSDYVSENDIVNAMLDDDYQDLEAFQNDILEYIDDEINVLNYTITNENYQQLNTLIESLWNNNED